MRGRFQAVVREQTGKVIMGYRGVSRRPPMEEGEPLGRIIYLIFQLSGAQGGISSHPEDSLCHT